MQLWYLVPLIFEVKLVFWRSTYRMNKAQDLKTCRACLEPCKKMYALVGPVVNLDINIVDMISYCTATEIELNENLPDSVCVACFKTIRIAYNFLRQFKESQEKLANQKFVQEVGLKEELLTKEELLIKEDKNSENDVCSDYNLSDLIYVKYESQIIHNYAMKNEQEGPVQVPQVEADEHTNLLAQPTENLEDIQSPEEERMAVAEHSVSVSAQPTNKKKYIKKQIVIQKSKISSGRFVCPICNAPFRRLQNLGGHIALHNKGTVVCNKCPTPVQLKISQYVEHYKLLHEYHCNICNKSLMSRYGYDYHMKYHENEKKYKCPLKDCGRRFILARVLRKHMDTHSEKINYTCNLCAATFRTYDTYRYHKITHDRRRNHLCPVCGKTYFQSVHLKDHMLKHAGCKPFACDICSKAFTTSSQLKKHVKFCSKRVKRELL